MFYILNVREKLTHEIQNRKNSSKNIIWNWISYTPHPTLPKQTKMTPKEKAKQLIERFYFQFPNNGSFTGINNVNSRWEEAVKCAIICCDEVLGFMGADRGTDFWVSVKEEIQTNYNSPKEENKSSFGELTPENHVDVLCKAINSQTPKQ